MDYDYNVCCMHLTSGVVHNFPEAVGVEGFCPYAQTDPRFLFEKSREYLLRV